MFEQALTIDRAAPDPGLDLPARLDPLAACDLRRRRRQDLAEAVIRRSAWLLPDDRALLRTVYQDGVRIASLATLRGRSESPRSLRRRVRVLVQRVLSARFTFVLRERDRWPPTRRRVAAACVLQGRTMRSAAHHLQISLHEVRRHLDAINALLSASRT